MHILSISQFHIHKDPSHTVKNLVSGRHVSLNIYDYIELSNSVALVILYILLAPQLSKFFLLLVLVCSNQGQLLVLLVNPVGMSSANGVVAQGFSFLVITCYVKYLLEIPAASFVMERWTFFKVLQLLLSITFFNVIIALFQLKHLPSPIEALELAAREGWLKGQNRFWSVWPVSPLV